jgi:hypothetical protein
LKHLVDTPPKLSECNRCQEYVLACMVSGSRVALDTSPLNSATLQAMILSGRPVYYSKTGKRFSLVTAHVFTYWRAFCDENTKVMVEHGCGALAVDSSAFEVSPATPHQAPASDPIHQLVAEVLGPVSEVVEDVRPHRSDIGRCAKCGVLMDHEDVIMLEVPVWQENVMKVRDPLNKRRKIEKVFKGWGCERWTIHPDGCPVPTNG